jgi:5-methylcytosine-specific restriction endonuclease McrA
MNATRNNHRSTRDSRSDYRGVCLRKDLRLAIYLRDSFRCVYCCADLHGAHPTDITLDHVHAQVDGGSNEPSNLVTACRTCNCSRQDKPLARFAGPETRKDIRRLTARSIRRYRTLAKAIIAGTTEDPRGNL